MRQFTFPSGRCATVAPMQVAGNSDGTSCSYTSGGGGAAGATQTSCSDADAFEAAVASISVVPAAQRTPCAMTTTSTTSSSFASTCSSPTTADVATATTATTTTISASSGNGGTAPTDSPDAQSNSTTGSPCIGHEFLGPWSPAPAGTTAGAGASSHNQRALDDEFDRALATLFGDEPLELLLSAQQPWGEGGSDDESFIASRVSKPLPRPQPLPRGSQQQLPKKLKAQSKKKKRQQQQHQHHVHQAKPPLQRAVSRTKQARPLQQRPAPLQNHKPAVAAGACRHRPSKCEKKTVNQQRPAGRSDAKKGAKVPVQELAQGTLVEAKGGGDSRLQVGDSVKMSQRVAPSRIIVLSGLVEGVTTATPGGPAVHYAVMCAGNLHNSRIRPVYVKKAADSNALARAATKKRYTCAACGSCFMKPHAFSGHRRHCSALHGRQQTIGSTAHPHATTQIVQTPLVHPGTSGGETAAVAAAEETPAPAAGVGAPAPTTADSAAQLARAPLVAVRALAAAPGASVPPQRVVAKVRRSDFDVADATSTLPSAWPVTNETVSEHGGPKYSGNVVPKRRAAEPVHRDGTAQPHCGRHAECCKPHKHLGRCKLSGRATATPTQSTTAIVSCPTAKKRARVPSVAMKTRKLAHTAKVGGPAGRSPSSASDAQSLPPAAVGGHGGKSAAGNPENIYMVDSAKALHPVAASAAAAGRSLFR